jgi:hypothetical protein
MMSTRYANLFIIASAFFTLAASYLRAKPAVEAAEYCSG